MINNYKLFPEIRHMRTQTAAQNNPLLLGHWGREVVCDNTGQARNFFTVLHVRAVKCLPDQKKRKGSLCTHCVWQSSMNMSCMPYEAAPVLGVSVMLGGGLSEGCVGFTLGLSLAMPPSAFWAFFAFALLPSSSALLETPGCSGCYPKLVWLSALFLLLGSSCLGPAPCFCPTCCLCQFFWVFLEDIFLFGHLFFSPIALERVCVRACVSVCVESYLLSIYICS